jgi:antitoxin Phd
VRERPSNLLRVGSSKLQRLASVEVFRRARSEGPQWITRQGREAVVMLPAEEFERLTGRAKQPRSLAKFFAESPLAKVPIDLERTPDCKS